MFPFERGQALGWTGFLALFVNTELALVWRPRRDGWTRGFSRQPSDVDLRVAQGGRPSRLAPVLTLARPFACPFPVGPGSTFVGEMNG